MSSSLVVYGTTGRRLLFSPDDVVMPSERFEAEAPGKLEWCTKQWEAMKGFYLARLERKDTSLSQLSLEEFTTKIADAVLRRLERQATAKRNRKKRLRAELAPKALLPTTVVVSNFVALDTLLQMEVPDRQALFAAVIERLTAFGKIASAQDLVDAEGTLPAGTSDGDSDASVTVDDRVALLARFEEASSAAAAHRELHNQAMLNGRVVTCELIPDGPPATAPAAEDTNDGDSSISEGEA